MWIIYLKEEITGFCVLFVQVSYKRVYLSMRVGAVYLGSNTPRRGADPVRLPALSHRHPQASLLLPS